MVQDGRLSGIVDVDVVCFGDPVWTIALTQMALLSSGYEVDYVHMWCDLVDLTVAQRQILSLYTAVFCVDFMSEIGQMFNQNAAVMVDQQHVQRLTSIFEDTLQAL